MKKLTFINRRIIVTNGILTGLLYLSFHVYDEDGNKLLSIPLLPFGFYRKLGLELRDMEVKLENRRQE